MSRRPRQNLVPFRRRRTGRRPPQSLWRPWRKTGIVALLAIFLIGGREWLVVSSYVLLGSTGCVVARVVDGDTVKAYCPGEGMFSARLIGFDTPEIYSPECTAEWLLGQKATFALRRMIWQAEDERMVLAGTDRYGRRLARLYLDGADIARSMISQGLARPYDGGRRAGWCA